MVAAFSVGGRDGSASRRTSVWDHSPMPLSAVASTGKVVSLVPRTLIVPGPAFSAR